MNAKEMLFLKAAVPAARASMAATGVPASITLAQAILESGWGQTGLAIEANNYFGIKATQAAALDSYVAMPAHEAVNGQTVAETADFAKYATVAAGFTAHGMLLSTAPRYAPAMAVRANPAEFAAAIQKCGYSTNPDYATELMQLVTEFDLTQYDAPPPAPAAVAAA